MILWIVFAVLCGMAALAVLSPLTRGHTNRPAPDDADLSIYRDQIDEIARDVQRGIIAEDEAAAARAEVGRRLLTAQSRLSAAPAEASKTAASGQATVWAVVTAVPLVSMALYLALGSPHLPGQPLEARLAAPVEQQDMQAMVVRVERHLAENPEDGRGWEVLAPVYQRLGRYADSARAWRNAVRLLGVTAERLANYGEAVVLAEDGLVTDEAREAFEQALAGDPTAIAPRFYLAMAAEQDGAWSEAAERWRAVLEDSPQGAPWRAATVERLAAAEEAAGLAPAGPTAEDMAAAQEMGAEERAAFVAGMVDRLAARLADDGHDLEGWLRLVRAHAVLGETEAARDAIASARAHFAGDPAAEERIDTIERELELDS